MAQIKQALVPDIGDYTDVPVIELLVQVGDRVSKDQGLVTLESDKATMEVPAPFAGVVREVKVKLGDTLSEGAVVALIEGDAEGGDETPDGNSQKPEPSAAKAQAPSDAAVPAKTEWPAKAEPAAAKAPSDAAVPEKTELPAKAESALDKPAAATPATRETRSPPVAFTAEAVLPANVAYASPSVRVFARELGVDLAQVTGSERGGRIGKADVQAFVKAALATGAGPATAAAGSGLNLIAWPKVDFAKFGEIERRPLSRINKLSGANLARNWAMIPHVTQFDEADISEMEAFRKRLGEEQKEVKVTPLVFLIKAVVAALQHYPAFNASLDGEELVLKKYFHIGIAVDTPDGLVVPVIRNADQKGLLALSKELAEISAKARDRKLGPADMSGGCFSISSLGGIGGSAFTPIINAPEVAILGVSKAQTKPLWNGNEFTPRLMLPLSLSYDHRVIDGAAAARFTAFLARTLGDLRRLLL